MRHYYKCMPPFIVILLVYLAGCVSDEANRYYLSEKLPPKDINEVEVLKQEPEKPYIVVADFQACGASVRHMQKRAAQIGADAVIVTPVGGWYSEGEIWADSDRNASSYSRLIGTAIKYKN